MPAQAARRAVRLGAYLLACLLLAPSPAFPGNPAPPPTRILFVGNSYLYTNDLPARVRQLTGRNATAPDTRMRAEPDYALADHLRERAFLEALAQPWDWVVLQQGPSSLSTSRDELMASARAIATRLAGRPTRIALFSAWPAAQRIGASREGEASYRLAAEAIGACVLPVAAAWRLAGDDRNMPALYQADRLHPTRAGTRLAALVVVRGLLGAGSDDKANLALDRIVADAYAQEPLACKPE